MKALMLAAGLALAAFAPTALAEVKDSGPGGFTLENSQVVPVDASRAWQALVDEVGDWWPEDHTWWGDASKLSIRARAGGCFCEINGRRQARHMQVVWVDPGRTLRMVGGLGPLQGLGLDGALEFRFTAEGEGTRITLWYRVGGYSPDDLSTFAPVVDGVMAAQLASLADHLRARATPTREER